MADPLDIPDLVDLPAAHESEGAPLLSRPARTPDPVHIILDVLRHVIIKDSVHAADINASGRHVRRNQDRASSVAESVHHHIPLVLGQVAVKPLGLIVSVL